MGAWPVELVGIAQPATRGAQKFPRAASCRISLSNVKSTKERNVSLAEEIARKQYASLVYKVEKNLEIETYDFEKLYRTWWTREKPSKSDARIRYIEGTVERYFIPYFTNVLSNKGLPHSRISILRTIILRK